MISSLIISKYAGCSGDFSSLERVEVIDINYLNSFSEALIKLYNYEWDYKWCKEVISGKYSLQEVSKKLSKYIGKSSNILKIELGEPDEDYKNAKGNLEFVYKTKKYGIPCERKFEVDSKLIVIGFVSNGCF